MLSDVPSQVDKIVKRYARILMFGPLRLPLREPGVKIEIEDCMS